MSAPPPVAHPLQAHPTHPDGTVRHIDVALRRQHDGGLQLDYRLHLRAAAPRLPTTPAAPSRADGLWRHTCCELFLGDAHSSAYREFNFSPAGAWAAYDFSACRERVADPALPPPAIALTQREGEILVRVALPAAALPPWGADARVGLSCVVEAADGRLAYWALAHPADQPDFHHAAGWPLSLSALPTGPLP